MKKHTWKFLAGGLTILAAIWFLSPSNVSSNAEILVSPRQGELMVSVTTTGELRAKVSTKIYGPTSARQVDVWDTKIIQIIPEGSIVQEGEIVAELDRSAIETKIRDGTLAIQKAQSQFIQAQLDSTLTLGNARDELINLRYVMEERKLAMEQSAYEAPSVKRQAEIEYDRAVRNYEQAEKNYQTKIRQAVAKMSEVEADLQKEQQKMETYQKILNDFTVKAPKGGMLVYARNSAGKMGVGSVLYLWDPVVGTLPNLDVMESVTYVNEVDIRKVKVGQESLIKLDAVTDKVLKGVVTQVANIGENRPNSDSKVFEVILEVTQRDTTLRPAMTTSNQILAALVEQTLAIPLETIHAQDSLTYVFKKTGSGVVRQQVEIGLISDSEAEVKRGVSLGDKIFLSIPADTTGLRLVRIEESIASNKAKN